MLFRSINAVENACPNADVSVQTELLLETSELLSEMRTALRALEEKTADCAAIADGKERALAYYREIVPAMGSLREPADRLEMIVDKEFWPIPSYGDMIFEVLGWKPADMIRETNIKTEADRKPI